FNLHTHRTHRDLHSFPTRRSSDLGRWMRRRRGGRRLQAAFRLERFRCTVATLDDRSSSRLAFLSPHISSIASRSMKTSSSSVRRSEEHTSELQSPYDLVCRLLLEK